MSFLRTAVLSLLAAWAPLCAADPIELFNGKDLTGWEGNLDFWSVQDGVIVGQTTKEKQAKANTFLFWRGQQIEDGELVFKCRLVDTTNNSGVMFRSKDVGNFVAKGYQIDIQTGAEHFGKLYDEGGRHRVAMCGEQVVWDKLSDEKETDRKATEGKEPENKEAEHKDPEDKEAENKEPENKESENIEIENKEPDGKDSADKEPRGKHSKGKESVKYGKAKVIPIEGDAWKTAEKKNDWNEIRVVGKGNHIETYLNGVKVLDFIDNEEAKRSKKGFIALQIHAGVPMRIEFKDLVFTPSE
jgi:hypothetical protein